MTVTNEQIILDKEWIEGVSLWIDGKGIFKAERPSRHDTVVNTALQYYPQEIVSKGILGFWTNQKHFVDRKEAAKIAFEAGQIAEPADCLISEDLW